MRKIDVAKMLFNLLEELFYIWIEANVYPISQQAIAKRIFKLVKEFKRIKHCPISKRGTVEEFARNIDQLFDVFNQNQRQRKEDEKYLLISYE